jgi:putative ABC transport system substrate-binding protein
VAAAGPLTARAQKPKLPVIGFLSAYPRDGVGVKFLAALRQGLADQGFVEDRNVAIEYRWAEGRYDQTPALAADLVARRVTVITTQGTPAALAAKAATTTIPIVFATGPDPVTIGLLESLGGPGGNLTGFANFVGGLEGKQLSLLRELLPQIATVGVRQNPTFSGAASQARIPVGRSMKRREFVIAVEGLRIEPA